MLDSDCQGFSKAPWTARSCPKVPGFFESFALRDRFEGLSWIWKTHSLPMSRILLIPIAVILAAGGVVLGPGEDTPASPAQTSITPLGDSGIHATNR
ncbi:hypothetical protein SAMN04489844_0297 [Nocardioides exalbidus]|uniref:Uncharacterized protein n=1 Tax=Nocardioides exalbidus TaxID=402596 RepID=A0A1H4JV78_9ACTN|nr:hypothetical protein SAMN04489844_0297 [Nocardioides exalbidus]